MCTLFNSIIMKCEYHYILAFCFCKCVVSNDGFNRNSNHNIVSASKGTDVGFNGSSILSVLFNLLFFLSLKVLISIQCFKFSLFSPSPAEHRVKSIYGGY